MKKFFQFSAICMFAVSSVAAIGCTTAEPVAEPPAASSEDEGSTDAGAEAVTEEGGSGAPASGGSGSH